MQAGNQTYSTINLPCLNLQDGASVGLAAAQITTASTRSRGGGFNAEAMRSLVRDELRQGVDDALKRAMPGLAKMVVAEQRREAEPPSTSQSHRKGRLPPTTTTKRRPRMTRVTTMRCSSSPLPALPRA